MRSIALVCLGIMLCVTSVEALIEVYSDGSDGSLSISTYTEIDLSLAVTAGWDTPGNGFGVYDSTKWAIVFKYSSVSIDAGANVLFINHPSRAPVVWLVQGDVTMSGGVVSLWSASWGAGGMMEPGPGGFRGGRGPDQFPPSAGFGPGGGGSYEGEGGAYGDGPAAYGNPRVLPLIGGSGGDGSGINDGTAGAGGGAILIAAAGTITIGSASTLRADGLGCMWGGGGSGGAIRLIAESVTGDASRLSARGGDAYWYSDGGVGRIRIEAMHNNLSGQSTPPYTYWPVANNAAVIWPLPGSPELRLVSVAGHAAPADPEARFDGTGDMLILDSGPIPVILESINTPTNWNVTLRVVPRAGQAYVVSASHVDGDSLSSTWQATLQPLPQSDFVAIQARAAQP